MWEPGTLVECIRVAGCVCGCPCPVKLGHRYTVRASLVVRGVWCVLLEGIEIDADHVAIRASLFRPLSSTGMKVLRETLKKVPTVKEILETQLQMGESPYLDREGRPL